MPFRPGWRHLLIAGVLFTAISGLAQVPSVSISPAALTVYPGEQNIPITVTLGEGDYHGPLVVTLKGLPSGISFAPLTLMAGGSGTLVLNASGSAGQEGLANTSLAGWTAQVTVVAAAGSLKSTAQLSMTISVSNSSFSPATSAIDLPIVRIDTSGVAITSKTDNVPGTITITSADGKTSYLPSASNTDNTATFHVHGNSTALMPKLPYHVKLNSSLDLLTAMGLTCPYVTGSGKAICDKSKSYILLANYDDKSLLRDWAASALANAIPMGNGYLTSPANSPSPTGTSTLAPWAPHSLFVELYINGQYEGNYQLIEEIKIDSHRVNISELSDSDVTDDISGGYLLEIDGRKDEAYTFSTPQGMPLGLIDPDFSPDPEVPEQTAYITGYVDTAENALFGANFTDPTSGWRAYFDEASAVNFYLVNDVMGNADGGEMFSSDYSYKDKTNPLLYMGPVWDFDISAGNVNYQPIVNPTVQWTQQSTWYKQWFLDPGFKADVVSQWNKLKADNVFENWLASISQQAAALKQSETNNFSRWPMLGIEVWPNSEAVGTYDGEVSYLTNWIRLRIAWLDSQFNNKAATATTFAAPQGTLRSGTPVTLTAHVSGNWSPTGSVSFLSNGTLLGTGALDGNGNATATAVLATGNNLLQAVYAGDSTNGLSASDSETVAVSAPLITTATTLTDSMSSSSYLPVLSVGVLGVSGTAVPGGTISFSANGTLVGTANVDASGAATFSPTALPAGNITIQASYSGDSNFAPSASNAITVSIVPPTLPDPVFNPQGGVYSAVQSVAISDSVAGASIFYTTDGSTPSPSSQLYSGPVTVGASETIQAIAVAAGYINSGIATSEYTINLPPPSFTFLAAPASVTIGKNEPAQFTLTVAPQNNFQGTVAFSCSGLPAGEICTFSPTSVTPNQAPATAKLTVSQSQDSAQLSTGSGLRGSALAGLVMAFVFCSIRKRRALLVVLAACLWAGIFVAGCGGSSKQQTSTTFTVTAKSGSISQSQVLTLTIE